MWLIERIADRADSMGLDFAYEFCARKLWRVSKQNPEEYQP